MNRNAAAFLLSVLALSTPACDGGGAATGADPAADRDKSVARVQTEAQAADAATLELSVAAYQKAVDEQVKVVEAALARTRELEPGELLSAVGDEVTTEADNAQKELTALKAKLEAYARELAKKKQP